jgi:hypothetical protein
MLITRDEWWWRVLVLTHLRDRLSRDLQKSCLNGVVLNSHDPFLEGHIYLFDVSPGKPGWRASAQAATHAKVFERCIRVLIKGGLKCHWSILESGCLLDLYGGDLDCRLNSWHSLHVREVRTTSLRRLNTTQCFLVIDSLLSAHALDLRECTSLRRKLEIFRTSLDWCCWTHLHQTQIPWSLYSCYWSGC